MRLQIKVIAIIIFSISKVGIAQTYWEPISFPDTLVIRSLNAEKEGVLFVCTGRQQNEYKGVFRSFDNGLSWEEIIVDTTVPYLNFYTINRDNEQALYLGTNGRIYRSFDDGNSFEKILEGVDNILTINFNDNNDIYAGGWCGIVRSIDDGINWDTICNGTTRFFSDIDFGMNDEIYTVGRDFSSGSGGGGFYRSLDDGLTWENTFVCADGSYSISVDNLGIINVDGYLISYDSGETWTTNQGYYSTDIENNQYEELIASYYYGLRLSQDWGESWTDISGNLSGSYIDQISIDPSGFVYLVKGHDYNQIYSSSNPVLINPIESKESNIFIYPNPSNGYFKLNTNEKESLKLIGVFNYLGQRITDVYLVNETLNMKKEKDGLYMIIVELNDQILVRRIVKK